MNACLVVSDTAGIDPASTLGRLERRTVPVGLGPGGLDVVVGVQHDGRCAQGPVYVSDDGGSATLPDDLDLKTFGSQQLGDGLRAGLHVCLVEGRERDTGDPGERFEVLAQGGQELAHPGLQGAQSGGVKVWGENVFGHDRERTHSCVRALLLARPQTGDTREGGHTTYSGLRVRTQEDP